MAYEFEQTDVFTLAGEVKGESCLSAVLPVLGQPPADAMIFAGALTGIDAVGAAGLRQRIEFRARRQSRYVTLGPPADSVVADFLWGAIAADKPKGLELSHDAPEPGPCPSSVLLPACRVPTLEHAEDIATILIGRATGPTVREFRFLARNLPDLVNNVVLHSGTVLPAVACFIYDRVEDELQLAVVDLGQKLASSHRPEQLVRARIGEANFLQALVDEATDLEIDISLMLAVGSGRVYWRAKNWSELGDCVHLPGFIAAITVHL
jgi:hypothetical protein